MISGEEIAQLIQHPEHVRREQLDDLNQLIKKYPYCSSLYILQIIGLANSASVHFEDELKTASVHVSDREHLFYLINPDTKT